MDEPTKERPRNLYRWAVIFSALLVVLAIGFAAYKIVVAESPPKVKSGCMLAPEGTTNSTFVVFTVGETLPTLANTESGGYTPPGNLDGMGAYIPESSSSSSPSNTTTLRVFVSHELAHDKAYEYTVNNGELTLRGARISYLDLDRQTLQVQAAGLAYDTIHDCQGNVPTDTSFLGTPFLSKDAQRGSRMEGFGRFCSALLIEKGYYGFEDTIYFANEEEGGERNSVGGNVWALDVENRELWQAAALGRAAFENVAPVATGNNNTVALILMDDTGPFNFRDFSFNRQFDSDDDNEAAPLYLYVGDKIPEGGFLERNGLTQGKLYVLILDDDGRQSAAEYNGRTAGLEPQSAKWVEITGSQNLTLASPDGTTGYDVCGYPTQAHRWTEAERLGAFGFSRPEDAHTNPFDSAEVVLSSTGRDKFADDADLVGTIYKIRTEFDDNSVPTDAEIAILYDGDADPNRGLRSPDNLFWSRDGYVYVQEDKAVDHDQGGVNLFGSKAINKNEAGIARLDPVTGKVSRVAGIDRRVVMDPTTLGTPYDVDWKKAGAWESSGIIEITDLVLLEANRCDRMFLANVQAHGIKDQKNWNSDSRIHDKDLYSGGQMVAICT